LARPTTGRESILIVDDEAIVRRALREQLKEEGYEAEEAKNVAEAQERLKQPGPSLVLLDLQLPDGNGLDLIPLVRSHWPQTPSIVMTGHGSVETAVRAIKMGAFSYLQKPLNPEELTVVLRQAIETNRLVQRAEDQRRREAERYSFNAIIAESPAMRRVLEEARIVTESPAATILLLGESGTGKGLVASAIHYASRRAANPFLKVTCSAIPETLLEAELMGHEKGAFTDAKAQRRGVFESADGGTVFLDEIGDMPLSLQAKLLGVLEDRSFSRVGGTHRIYVDVRLIAATHRDLNQAVEEGRFREDLLYRLHVVPIVIPALRDRTEDIVPLAESFRAAFNREFGRQVEGFDDNAVAYLEGHSWPGNVRELRNAVERAMLFSRKNVLTQDDFLLETGYRPRLGRAKAPGAGASFVLPPDGIQLNEFEQELVRQAMNRAGGNQSRAAALLGISRDQIRYRLEKMGLLKSSKSKRADA
jgi:DNA-binding NtrC family response regulator